VQKLTLHSNWAVWVLLAGLSFERKWGGKQGKLAKGG